MTHVEKGSFLTLHYKLSGPDGATLISTFGGPPATLSMGAHDWAPAIQAKLLGLACGTQTSWTLAPGEAFGPRQAQLVQKVTHRLLDELGPPQVTYQVGDVVQFPTPDGQGTYAGTVREVLEDGVLFDFNHPLAGQSVTFDVHLIGVL